MTNLIQRLVGATCALLVTLSFASAETVHGPEAQYSYDSVRGWDVYALSLRDGVHGCRAIKQGAAGPLIIENYRNEWNLIVRSSQTGVFTGGVVAIDGYLVDSQFGLKNGYGIKTLTSPTLGRLKAGSQVNVRINGDRNQSFSLSGSTAAILKVEECAKNRGEKPQASSTSTNMPPPQQSDQQKMTCRSVTDGDYSCTIKFLPSDPGYVETVQIFSNAGSTPTYFYKIRDGGQQADTWVSFDRGAWKYMGVWLLSDDGTQRCAEPAPNQSDKVQQALGQDAWQLCLF